MNPERVTDGEERESLSGAGSGVSLRAVRRTRQVCPGFFFFSFSYCLCCDLNVIVDPWVQVRVQSWSSPDYFYDSTYIYNCSPHSVAWLSKNSRNTTPMIHLGTFTQSLFQHQKESEERERGSITAQISINVIEDQRNQLTRFPRARSDPACTASCRLVPLSPA